MKTPLLLGHRGLRSRAFSIRENTISAFDLALQHGCDGFEFDVRLTADESAVVCHGPKFAGIAIAKNKASRVRALPVLNDVLARYAGRAFLDIELKVSGVAPCLLSAISEHPPQHGYVVSSFLPNVLIGLRNHNSSVPLGIICETRKQLSVWRDLPIEYVIAHQRLVNPELLRDAHAAGKAVFAWTVNKKASMIRLANSGIDGIISDKTDLLVATLRHLG
jgi:glycerophosphoryl diester phosphodiesterase